MAKFIVLVWRQYKLFYLRFLFRKPVILTKEATIEAIKNGSSIARYGDGEFALMAGTGDPGFQKLDERLQAELISCFRTHNRKLLVCAGVVDVRRKKEEADSIFRWKRYYAVRTFWRVRRLFDKKYIYGNAGITRFYQPENSKGYDYPRLAIYVDNLRSIWTNKDLLIVEGQDTKLGCGNDLFSNALSIRRIVCPSVNAFSLIDQIFKKCISYMDSCIKPPLVLISLGPSASVLATWIATRTKYQAIDIGHVDVVYMWYLNQVDERVGIQEKYVNEQNVDRYIPLSINLQQYQAEIIAAIGV